MRKRINFTAVALLTAVAMTVAAGVAIYVLYISADPSKSSDLLVLQHQQTVSDQLLDPKREIEVDFSQFRQLLPRDAIYPIYDPRFKLGKSTSLDSGGLVIGVAINGESKAYPVGPLNYREMVNDVVGGVPVLVNVFVHNDESKRSRRQRSGQGLGPVQDGQATIEVDGLLQGSWE